MQARSRDLGSLDLTPHAISIDDAGNQKGHGYGFLRAKAEIRPELPGDLFWRGCLNNAAAHGATGLLNLG